MNSDYEISRERLARELEGFRDQLKVARSDYEKQRLKATIQGTEMMLAVIPAAQAAEQSSEVVWAAVF